MAGKGKNKKNLIILGVTALVVIILLVLFSFGAFYVPGPPQESCVAASGYLCQNPIYNHTTGNIITTLRQNTDTNWSTTNFVFVPQGTPTINGIPNISFISNPANTTYGALGKGLDTRQNILISLPVSAPVNINTIAFGTVWVEYTTKNNNVPEYAQIATVNIKAS